MNQKQDLSPFINMTLLRRRQRGEYKAGTYKATGEADSRVESALKDYAIEGVQFSYLRVGNVETHSVQEGTGTTVELVYEIPTDLAKILGLTEKDNIDMTGEKRSQSPAIIPESIM